MYVLVVRPVQCVVFNYCRQILSRTFYSIFIDTWKQTLFGKVCFVHFLLAVIPVAGSVLGELPY